MNAIKFGIFWVFLLISVDLNAQTTWNYNPNAEERIVSVEWVRPTFEEDISADDNISFFSSVLFIQGYLPAGDGFSFTADLPLSHWGFTDDDGIDTQDPHTTVGNIYIGGSYRFNDMADGRFSPSIELGTRLPTMPEPDFPDKRGFTVVIIQVLIAERRSHLISFP